MHVKDVKVVGVGGTGCCLLPALSRFLAAEVPDCSLTLVDGDAFEDDNRARQPVPRLGNKAAAMAERLRLEFPFPIRARPVYLTARTARSLLREGDVVLLCVDNHASRQVASRRCGALRDVLLISGGNALTTGTILVYHREGGEDRTLPLTSHFHPGIRSPEPWSPRAAGCARRAPSQPQCGATNNFVAAVMLAAFASFLKGTLACDEFILDTLTGACRPVSRTPRPVATEIRP